MIILSVDSTTRSGSIAVLRDGRVLFEGAGDAARTVAERLPTDLMHALDAGGVELKDVDLFAVAAGPGSFTGLRVGIATVQGLAMAGRRKVFAASVLDALAWAAANENENSDRIPIAAWMDAQRGQVFGALYEPDGFTVRAGPSSLTPAGTLDEWGLVGSARFIGDGAERYTDDIRMAMGETTAILPHPLLASVIGRMANDHPDQAVVPHAVVPIYVRRPDAEIARARRIAGNPAAPRPL
jgi:tRNA threonylcarbamoyladenosine biosynthesis protein TsaB